MKYAVLVFNILLGLLVLFTHNLDNMFHKVNVERHYAQLRHAGCIDQEKLRVFIASRRIDLPPDDNYAIVGWLLANPGFNVEPILVVLALIGNFGFLYREIRIGLRSAGGKGFQGEK